MILVTVGTIIGGIGMTYLMSSMYCSGLSLVVANAILMVFVDKITSRIIGAFGAEHQSDAPIASLCTHL